MHDIDGYVSRPFRYDDLAHLSRAELRGRLWSRPHHGVVSWYGLDPEHPATRVRAAAAAEPGVPLGTWAAAYVHGASDLDGRGWDGNPVPVVFCPGRSGRRRPRAGLIPLRSTVEDDDVVEVDGLLVTSPVRTAFDLGRTACDLYSAVADVDALLRATQVDLGDLAEYAARRPRWKGAPLLRRAIPLVDPRSRSRPESRMRVIWVRDARLPAPEANVPVHSTIDGRLLGLPDLLDPASGLVAEYDGAHHREYLQHASDNVREEVFEQHGLTVVRAVWRDVARRDRLVHRLRTGYELARRRTRGHWAL